jgi:hypothetical protein
MLIRGEGSRTTCASSVLSRQPLDAAKKFNILNFFRLPYASWPLSGVSFIVVACWRTRMERSALRIVDTARR